MRNTADSNTVSKNRVLCFINIIRSISVHSHTGIDCKYDKADSITQCVYLEVNDKKERPYLKGLGSELKSDKTNLKAISQRKTIVDR